MLVNNLGQTLEGQDFSYRTDTVSQDIGESKESRERGCESSAFEVVAAAEQTRSSTALIWRAFDALALIVAVHRFLTPSSPRSHR